MAHYRYVPMAYQQPMASRQTGARPAAYPQRGYEPEWWEKFEEQFYPPWLKQMEKKMGFKPGQEPLWWELFEEQFEPPWLQVMERRLGIPQPYDPRYDFPRWRIL